MTTIALALAVVLTGISLLHVYWAMTGVGGSAGVPSRTDGKPVFRPGPIATLAVAAALAFAAIIVLGRASFLTVGLPEFVLRAGIWGIAATFVARTIGEFRYVGLFKRVRGTPFAMWDTRLFTPLCAGIAIAATLVAIS